METMTPSATKYYSTNGRAPEVTFREAILRGQAPDKGLYMPREIPAVTPEELAAMQDQSYPELAFTVLGKYVPPDQVPRDDLHEMIVDAYDFDVPIERVTGDDFIVRLDRGPTASFKDFAARMLGRLMAYFLVQEGREATILTATSGDTGGAVADAFFGLPGVRVVVLFPVKEVSGRQRRQMTTLGKNITAVGVDGKFDDCQRLVKGAFADPELEGLNLSSANSINFGRLVPQTVYYFYAWSRIASDPGERIVVSVPSGNFGNLMGGLLAKHMGLPVSRFIAAVNENDEVPKFLQSGRYEKVVPSRNCLSNAMNVGHPSNLARIVALYGGQMDETGTIHEMPDMARLRGDVYSTSVSDDLTRETISKVYAEQGVLLEPHGAVGWAALLAFKEEFHPPEKCVSLETADPAKFPEVIRELLEVDPPMPPKMVAQQGLEEVLHEITPDAADFKKFLLMRLD
ncbi:MAG: threonine synthase [Promethearchaeota archaeon]